MEVVADRDEVEPRLLAATACSSSALASNSSLEHVYPHFMVDRYPPVGAANRVRAVPAGHALRLVFVAPGERVKVGMRKDELASAFWRIVQIEELLSDRHRLWSRDFDDSTLEVVFTAQRDLDPARLAVGRLGRIPFGVSRPAP
jgi:hypothetical protein